MPTTPPASDVLSPLWDPQVKDLFTPEELKVHFTDPGKLNAEFQKRRKAYFDNRMAQQPTFSPERRGLMGAQIGGITDAQARAGEARAKQQEIAQRQNNNNLNRDPFATRLMFGPTTKDGSGFGGGVGGGLWDVTTLTSSGASALAGIPKIGRAAELVATSARYPNKLLGDASNKILGLSQVPKLLRRATSRIANTIYSENTGATPSDQIYNLLIGRTP